MRAKWVAIGLTALLPSLHVTLAADPNEGPSDLSLSLDDKGMVTLPSRWAEYFGRHYSSSPDGAGVVWSTV